MRHYRISDQNPIKTKRLIITPLTAKQLSVLEAQEEDELLRGALVEMRKNVMDDHGYALWYTGWQVSLRNGGTPIGLLGFHGPTNDQTVELNYEIKEEYRGNGYCQEAVKALTNWAFGCDGVYFISVLSAKDNGASNHILEQLKYYRVESPVANQRVGTGTPCERVDVRLYVHWPSDRSQFWPDAVRQYGYRLCNRHRYRACTRFRT
ncbi:MAG: hypothetical protein C0413_05675 [Clostridiales bacterium]|nr:hypothetical protein [Clostridiales bacterium]